MYESGGGFWRGHPKQVDDTTVAVDGDPFWTSMRDCWVLVLSGRGVGQWRRVTANTTNLLAVSPAWDVLPDAGSYLLVNGAFVENLWIDNTEEHTANWTGFWGMNIANVIDGHILRDGAGLYLWSWDNTQPTPVCFCDLIGSFVSGRGQIRLIGPQVFGNTVRFCQVVGARPGPSYHGTPYWLPDYDPKAYAAIDLGSPEHKMAELPADALLDDWNVIEGCNLAEAATGLRIAKDVRHLLLRHNVIKVDGEAVHDESGAAVVR
jgi:hypothetical protein